jgi:hypothetical protein
VNFDCASQYIELPCYFHRHYLDHIAEEINEKLQESGLVSIGELAKTFGFTTDFMLEV